MGRVRDQVSLHLFQHLFIDASVQLEQSITSFQILTLFEIGLGSLPRDLGFYRDGLIGLDSADRLGLYGE